ncbi:hypothetical protein ACFQZI_06975 [Mucilaginibacter lutimaris]|uniref:Uncharacterized protein n=1 Tax=Mucilaginibacter lutimaris TaxID=931629 RepID=A0ABW2ZEE1_9SPHI
MKTYYKISRLPDGRPGEQGQSFGPSFKSKKKAKHWLAKNAQADGEYVISTLFAASFPEDIKPKKQVVS